jgi:hypothetical protein
MKQLLAGFIDAWKVLIINSWRDKDPIFNIFDLGVLLGIASMGALVIGIFVVLAKIFS